METKRASVCQMRKKNNSHALNYMEFEKKERKYTNKNGICVYIQNVIESTCCWIHLLKETFNILYSVKSFYFEVNKN